MLYYAAIMPSSCNALQFVVIGVLGESPVQGRSDLRLDRIKLREPVRVQLFETWLEQGTYRQRLLIEQLHRRKVFSGRIRWRNETAYLDKGKDFQESTPIEQHGLSRDNSIEGSVLVIEAPCWSSRSGPRRSRMFVLSRFALRKVNGIIRTDAVGCGIDIDDIDVVISSTCRATSTRKLAGPGEQEQKKFQLTLAEAGRQPLEPIEIHSNAVEEYAVLYSAVLNDLCEALDQQKQTIKKIHSGMSNTSMTKGFRETWVLQLYQVSNLKHGHDGRFVQHRCGGRSANSRNLIWKQRKEGNKDKA
ncbi:hypothetical protein quinque_008794 [Culex quinquefasciatus]